MGPALLPEKRRGAMCAQRERYEVVRLSAIVRILEKRVEQLEVRLFLLLLAVVAAAATLAGAILSR